MGRVISNRPSVQREADLKLRARLPLNCTTRGPITNCVNNKMHETLCCFCQARSFARCACRVTRIVNFRQCFVFFTLKAFEINSVEQVVKFYRKHI